MYTIKEKILKSAKETEETLTFFCPEQDNALQKLFDAESYSLLGGGKRIRPFIVKEVCEALGGDRERAAYYGAALEMIHTYSLIHDDLPCMDDDDMRRGKPTNHKVFGYATALLAGDARLTKAFWAASTNPYCTDGQNAEAVRRISLAAGERGMIGGQIIDLEGEQQKLEFGQLLRLHRLKTGALISCAAELGAISAGYGIATKEYREAVEYAEGIGLAFQVVDDILDATATEAELGKTVGSDAARGKTTFLSYFDAEGARAYARELTEGAVRAIANWNDPDTLTELAYYLLDRKN